MELNTIVNISDTYINFGDFIFPLIKWNNLTFPLLQNYILFKDFLLRNEPIYQINNLPTRNNTILDIILTNKQQVIFDLYVEPPLKSSDHTILLGKIKPLQKNKPNNRKIPVKSYRTANYNLINKLLENGVQNVTS